MNFTNLEEACRLACEQLGVIYKPVPSEGQWHTADLANDSKGKKDARIKLFPDRQGGIVWNHKSGEKLSFFVNRTQPLPVAERDRIEREQQKRQAELLRKQDKAAAKAVATFIPAPLAPPNHSYFVRKQIGSYGARLGTWYTGYEDANGKRQKLVIENSLLLPMYNADGAIRSLQAIFPEKIPELGRDKDFLPGSSIAGLFWWVGGRKTPKILIAEGFATAATLHEQTGYRVYIAFTANNLMAVGRIIREKLPDAEIIFAADNDTNTAGNPGLAKATEAAQAVGGLLAVPPIAGDFNDYAALTRRAHGA